MLTYGNHFWRATASAQNLGLLNDDVLLACMPLFHVGGLAILLRGIIYGNTVIVHEAFDPDAVNKAIDDHGVTIFSAVSNMLLRIIESRGGENRGEAPPARTVALAPVFLQKRPGLRARWRLLSLARSAGTG